jgi:hypothetical protein
MKTDLGAVKSQPNIESRSDLFKDKKVIFIDIRGKTKTLASCKHSIKCFCCLCISHVAL